MRLVFFRSGSRASAILLLAVLLTVSVGAVAPPPANAVAPVVSNHTFGFSDGSIIFNAKPKTLDRWLRGMRRFGASWIRLDLNWTYIQRCRRCAPRWQSLERVITLATAHHLRVLLTLDYAPPWANGHHDDDKWFPTSDADWSTIVRRTVEKFGSTVKAYEVWNEPNTPVFGNYGNDKPKTVLARYWELVRLAHAQMCADCTLLAGGSVGDAGRDASAETRADRWLAYAYDPAHSYVNDFDAVTYHPYPPWPRGLGPDHPECARPTKNWFGPPSEHPPCGMLAAVHKVMAEHGDTTKKIWATEWGYPTAGGGVTNPRTIAAYDVKGLRMWRSLDYTGPLFMHAYRDRANCAVLTTDPECNYGVVHHDFSPKTQVFDRLERAISD